MSKLGMSLTEFDSLMESIEAGGIYHVWTYLNPFSAITACEAVHLGEFHVVKVSRLDAEVLEYKVCSAEEFHAFERSIRRFRKLKDKKDIREIAARNG